MKRGKHGSYRTQKRSPGKIHAKYRPKKGQGYGRSKMPSPKKSGGNYGQRPAAKVGQRGSKMGYKNAHKRGKHSY